jgi:hypothetical protein
MVTRPDAVVVRTCGLIMMMVMTMVVPMGMPMGMIVGMPMGVIVKAVVVGHGASLAPSERKIAL